MAWTDPSLTGYNDDPAVLAELLYAINEREEILGLDLTTWNHSGGILAAKPNAAAVSAAGIPVRDMYQTLGAGDGLLQQMSDALDALDIGAVDIGDPRRWTIEFDSPDNTSTVPTSEEYTDTNLATHIANMREAIESFSNLIIISRAAAYSIIEGTAVTTGAGYANSAVAHADIDAPDDTVDPPDGWLFLHNWKSSQYNISRGILSIRTDDLASLSVVGIDSVSVSLRHIRMQPVPALPSPSPIDDVDLLLYSASDPDGLNNAQVYALTGSLIYSTSLDAAVPVAGGYGDVYGDYDITDAVAAAWGSPLYLKFHGDDSVDAFNAAPTGFIGQYTQALTAEAGADELVTVSVTTQAFLYPGA